MSTELQPGSGHPATIPVDAVIVGLSTGESTGNGGPVLAVGGAEVDAAFDGGLAALLAVAGATGKADEVVKVPTRGALAAPLLVAVGLGKGDPSSEAVRRASGAAARALAGTGHAASTLGRIDLAAAAEGTLLGAYTFTTYRTNGDGKAPVGRVDLLTDDSHTGSGDATDVLRVATAVATPTMLPVPMVAVPELPADPALYVR
ncbi:MAG: leucyl aminopeptidase, partial [Pseudonocardia sp.]|nr:leucyl aminopeptidase [Pseudonocardia sp.]